MTRDKYLIYNMIINGIRSVIYYEKMADRAINSGTNNNGYNNTLWAC